MFAGGDGENLDAITGCDAPRLTQEIDIKRTIGTPLFPLFIVAGKVAMTGQPNRSGRPKKPVEQHIKEGTYRPDRHGPTQERTASHEPAPPPAPPSELAAAGRRLWDATLMAYDLDGEHDRAVLIEACRCRDALDALDAVVRAEGVVTTDRHGGRVAHPALVEARQQRGALTRLLGFLAIPEPPSPPGVS